MEIRRIKGIKRIVIPQQAGTPGAASNSLQLVAGRRRKRKKLSKSSKFLEKVTRRAAKANRSGLDDYLARHDRSNRKKKNGWLKDLSKNVFRSSKKGRKSFKLSSLF
ncbi:DUF6312 domain-containing protein [Polyangium jinanense]|uniref:Uncharacterized protein n=1 Tax=Polyangium jinanense TaxID=2829994 RepID=A0A9X4AS69_9BACT|nr:hypothetical protein [Polyangium jinanense]MDC3955564.1 hypothetical protein [Polyangium jinanense]MDC3982206.1 hypothetical protein [Polyangium jinanense]